MTPFWLLCVCLVLCGLAFRREVTAVLNGLRLQVFGVRQRVISPRRLPQSPPPSAPRPTHNFLPPPRVVTRPGP
jgi:hypothetical protein